MSDHWGCTEHSEDNPSSACDACFLMERIQALEAELAEEKSACHLADGVAHLAMKHRDLAEAQLERVTSVGFNTHPSWNCGEEFDKGWNECRKQVEQALKEQK